MPREAVVSCIVWKLVSRIDRALALGGVRGGSNDVSQLVSSSVGCCVAILSSPPRPTPSNSDGGDDHRGGSAVIGVAGGEGKTMIAVLVCMRDNVMAQYRRGMAWLGPNDRRCPPPDNLLDYESYSKALFDVCHQIGVELRGLCLSPVVRTPGEDSATVVNTHK